MTTDASSRTRPSRPPAVLAIPAAAAFLLLAACGGSGAEGRDAGGGDTTSTVSATSLFGGGVRSDGARRSEAPAPSRDTQSIDLSGLGFTHGSPDAPIRVVEFSDFGCGYCRKFHMETYPTVKDEYIDTGKVMWKYIPFVLGMFPNAVEAAVAGECAGAQDHFPVMRDRLFEDQGAWRKSSEPYELFKRFAREEGLNADRFARCVDERRPMERVRANVQAGRQVGVRGTPMFVVEGFPLQGALPLSVFRDVFDRILERRQQQGGPGADGS